MEDIIEETFENVPLTKIINSIFRLVNKERESNIDIYKLKDELPFNLLNNLNVFVKDFIVNIEYKGVPFPKKSKIFEFEDANGKKKYYRIYTENFFEEVANKYKLKSKLFICEGKIREDLNFQGCLTILDKELFKVVEKKEIDYKIFFKKVDEKKEKDKFNQNITWNKLTTNCNYYFKNSKGEDKFYFIYSRERSDLLESLLQSNKPIECYCGPHGIGKTMTFLVFKNLKKNVCYFNLKALFKNSSNPLIWKKELLLKELADTFSYASDYTKFDKLLNELVSKDNIWDSIYHIFEFMVKEQIEIKFIIDQYKEKLDKNYDNIKKIIEIINKNSTLLSIIILSSINDKDVRLSLFDLWLKKDKKESFLVYIYLTSLFDMKEIINEDKSLSQNKKNMIINEFNCIPKYYYLIKNIEEKDLEKFRNEEIRNIRDKFEEFFLDNPLSIEGINLLVNYNYQFSLNGELENNIFEKIIKFLPFKYFIMNIRKYIINYYFPLIEDIFNEILSQQSLIIFQSPVSSLKPSVIGDILEYNLTTDLSKNKFGHFDYVCKIDSVYSLRQSSYSSFENLDKTNILLVQSNPYARYIDFGIINNGKDLILFQCKKALLKEPKNYVKFEDILRDKNYLARIFQEKFKIKIQNIYLLYITGISFYKEGGETKLKTWGINKKENFKILIKMCKNGQCELLYYDVINKIIYQKIKDIYNPIGDLIAYVKQLRHYIIIDKNSEKSIENFNQEKINFIDNKILLELSSNIKPLNKNEDFFSEEEKEVLKKNNYLNKFTIVGKIQNPNDLELNAPVFIGFKRTNKKYLSFYDKNKKKKIIEISNNSIKEIENYFELLQNPIEECFYMQREY